VLSVEEIAMLVQVARDIAPADATRYPSARGNRQRLVSRFRSLPEGTNMFSRLSALSIRSRLALIIAATTALLLTGFTVSLIS